MGCCCHSPTCRCVRTACVSAFVAWFSLLAVTPPKIRHEHPVTDSQPAAQHVHHEHSHATPHHQNADQADTTKTLTLPLVHWHVWLAGFDWTFPAGQNPSDESDDDAERLIVSSVLSHFTPTVSHGNEVALPELGVIPQESCPTAAPPVLLWRDPWRTGPPLCDAARGLRSGVEQV